MDGTVVVKVPTSNIWLFWAKSFRLWWYLFQRGTIHSAAMWILIYANTYIIHRLTYIHILTLTYIYTYVYVVVVQTCRNRVFDVFCAFPGKWCNEKPYALFLQLYPFFFFLSGLDRKILTTYSPMCIDSVYFLISFLVTEVYNLHS